MWAPATRQVIPEPLHLIHLAHLVINETASLLKPALLCVQTTSTALVCLYISLDLTIVALQMSTMVEDRTWSRWRAARLPGKGGAIRERVLASGYLGTSSQTFEVERYLNRHTVHICLPLVNTSDIFRSE
ncbi:uncharacterized protein L3040_006675 [Drepanopeziza brunnea f. sp. 'multigermtubi']|uniref:uncharacterized protein n=1 Tax=Drepanopeziza brunnea f. sp. 'multigermtubi' TaxID=698441 RepID=UPI00238384E7|nr:hypothetical protein L3040_006675 [Drepanopeziza brunnea f. sp. 'multigermtubi']